MHQSLPFIGLVIALYIESISHVHINLPPLEKLAKYNKQPSQMQLRFT